MNILRSRTVWFAVFLAAVSVAQGYVFLLPIPPVQQMWAGIAIAVAVTILRIITTKPLSEK